MEMWRDDRKRERVCVYVWYIYRECEWESNIYVVMICIMIMKIHPNVTHADLILVSERRITRAADGIRWFCGRSGLILTRRTDSYISTRCWVFLDIIDRVKNKLQSNTTRYITKSICVYFWDRKRESWKGESWAKKGGGGEQTMDEGTMLSNVTRAWKLTTPLQLPHKRSEVGLTSLMI